MMHSGFGGFGMILFWIALIAAVIILVKTLTNSSGKDGTASKKPLDILKRRYAAGEITNDEFEEMRRNLVKRQ